MPQDEMRCTGCGRMMSYNPDSVWRPWVDVTTWSANEYYCLERCWKAMKAAITKSAGKQEAEGVTDAG